MTAMGLRLLSFAYFEQQQIRSRMDDPDGVTRGGASGGGCPKPDSELVNFVRALARATARQDHRQYQEQARPSNQEEPAK